MILGVVDFVRGSPTVEPLKTDPNPNQLLCVGVIFWGAQNDARVFLLVSLFKRQKATGQDSAYLKGKGGGSPIPFI